MFCAHEQFVVRACVSVGCGLGHDVREVPQLLRGGVCGQFLRWKASWKNHEGLLPSAVLTTLSKWDRSFFRLIHMLLRIYATLPVHTAEVERGFSSTRRIKTFLRSTMSKESQVLVTSVYRNKKEERILEFSPVREFSFNLFCFACMLEDLVKNKVVKDSG